MVLAEIDLLLIAGIPVVIGVVWLAWKYGFVRGSAGRLETAVRRREDARDWQRRFGSDSPLTDSFFPPTQNEILETLYVLDHLTPGWETGEAALVERSFLHELALNFPTLCKSGGSFPLGSGENPGTAETAARREAFKARRAQINALDQITSGPPALSDASPDPAEDRVPTATRTEGSLWPVLLGSAAVLVAVALYGARFFPHPVTSKATEQTAATPSASPETVVDDDPTPLPSPESVPAVAESAPPPAPAPTTKVAEADPVVLAPATPSREKELLNQQIAASKQRAVAKYPSLAVEGSEINLRFVFRYNNLVQQNSPRLLDPNWPEQLVDECATAAGVAPKRAGLTQVLGNPR